MSRPECWQLVWCLAWSLGAATMLTALMRWLAPRVGMLDHPAGRKDHARPTPLLGGVAIYLACILGYGVTAHFDARTVWVLLGGAVVLALGLWDDRVGLRARLRLVLQLVGASGVVIAGFGFNWFAWRPADDALTLIWLLGVMNAMNCLDCADGAASGVAAIAAGTYGVIAIAYGHFAVATMSFALAGACVGFLLFNFPPASIFLGDAGSTLLGLLLGTLAIAGSHGAQPLHHVWVAALPLAVPVWDILLVHLRRYRCGTRSLRALLESSGRDHLPHRLRQMGLGSRGVALSVYAVALVLAVPGALIARYERNALILAGEVGLLFLLAGERPFGELGVTIQGWLLRTPPAPRLPARARAAVREHAPVPARVTGAGAEAPAPVQTASVPVHSR